MLENLLEGLMPNTHCSNGTATTLLKFQSTKDARSLEEPEQRFVAGIANSFKLPPARLIKINHWWNLPR
jgi:hypothetical protein